MGQEDLIWSEGEIAPRLDEVQVTDRGKLEKRFVVNRMLGDEPGPVRELSGFYDRVELSADYLRFRRQNAWRDVDEGTGTTSTTTTSREDEFALPAGRILDSAYSKWKMARKVDVKPLWLIAVAGAVVAFLGLILIMDGGDDEILLLATILMLAGIGAGIGGVYAHVHACDGAEEARKGFPKTGNRVLLGYRCGLLGRHQMISIESGANDLSDLHASIKRLLSERVVSETYQLA